MPFAQGDVLILPFPYSDRMAEKKRPALVVSKPSLEKNHGLVWVAMITSDHGNRRATDTPVSDLKRTGLPAASLVRPVKLATVEPARVLRKSGALARKDMDAVLTTIANVLGLEP
jgi:mRNA interferase MazF